MIRGISTCALCSNSATHLVIREYKHSCPANGANVKLHCICTDHLDSELKELDKPSPSVSATTVMEMIKGTYSDAGKIIYSKR